MAHQFTGAVLKSLQARYTAPRVWLVGLSIDLDGFVLEVAVPSGPEFRPAVPFDIRLVERTQHHEPVRYAKICDVWIQGLTTVVDALSRINGFCPHCKGRTKIEALAAGEAPGHSIEGVLAGIVNAPRPEAPAPEENWTADATGSGREQPPAPSSGRCGCGARLCPHGHCSESCDGFPCGDCGSSRGADK